MTTKIYVSQIDTANTTGGQAPVGSLILVGSNGPYWSNATIEDLLGIHLNEITGYTGSVGYTGSAGSIGYFGSVGYVGSAGGEGPIGAVGFTGSAGYLGSTGYTGSVGDVGYRGSVGFTGSAGPGYTGSVGNVGYQGSAGGVGYQGSVGYRGSQGAPGIIQFNQLSDVPQSYTGANGYFVRVNSTANGIFFDSNTYLTANITSPLNLNNSTLKNPTLQNYSELVNATGASTNPITIDVRNGNINTITLSQPIVQVILSNTGLISGHLYNITLMLKQDSTGGRTIDWSSQTIYWPAGEAIYSPNGPALSVQAGYTDFITLMTMDAGTTWYGVLSAKGFPTS